MVDAQGILELSTYIIQKTRASMNLLNELKVSRVIKTKIIQTLIF